MTKANLKLLQQLADLVALRSSRQWLSIVNDLGYSVSLEDIERFRLALRRTMSAENRSLINGSTQKPKKKDAPPRVLLLDEIENGLHIRLTAPATEYDKWLNILGGSLKQLQPENDVKAAEVDKKNQRRRP